MKPRQGIKNVNSTSLSQSCLPPPLPPQLQQPPSTQSHNQQRHLTNLQGSASAASLLSSVSSSSVSGLSREVDLAAKFGINLNEMPNLQANPANISTQEDLFKCLQALYGKSGADLMQKLPPSSDWPSQSISPPNLSSRTASGGNSLLSSSSGSNNSNNYNINVTSSKLDRQKQDSQSTFTTNPHLPPTSPSSMSALNQNFRASSASTSNATSSSQLQQHQQRSVLSLHQQQRQSQHHQNDPSTRKLSQHNHPSSLHMNTANTTNAASFVGNINTNANVVAAAAAAAVAAASPADTNNLASALSGKNSSSVSTNAAPNIVDQFNSIDDIFYDRSMQANNNNNNRDSSMNNNQQSSSLIKHQQLQKLLKATTNSTGVTASQQQSKQVSSGTLAHNLSRNDHHNRGNNLGESSMPPHLQRQLSTTSSSSILSNHHQQQSTTHYPSVPKSLLNLAACTSTSPISNAGLSSSRLSSINQLNLLTQGRNLSTTNNNRSSNNSNNNSNLHHHHNTSRDINKTNTKSTSYNNSASFSNTNSSNDLSLLQRSEPTNVSQQHNRQSISTTSSSIPSSISSQAPSAKSSLKQHLQFSLLSDSQSTPQTTNNRGNLRNVDISANYSNQQNQAHINQSNLTGSINNLSLDIGAFTSNIQDLVNKSSHGTDKTSKASQATSLLNPNVNSSICQAITNSSLSISPSINKDDQYGNHQFDSKEIESAISRVEARNDLSLLYPPVLLASNSQKQLNALSARLRNDDNESEACTKEIKKIVLEECNIIYECKQCSNLFRSLANLVHHKRTYCVEQSSARSSLEVNKRYTTNPLVATDPTQVSHNSSNQQDQRIEMDSTSSLNNTSNINITPTLTDIGSQASDAEPNRKYNLRCKKHPKMNNDLRMLRTMSDQERRQQRERGSLLSQNNQPSNASQYCATQPQTSLSKLLQSQPKSRLPSTKDNTLMGAITIGPVLSTEVDKDDHQTSAFTSDDVMNSQLSDIHNQITRNSSLAKTLLNEKIRSSNSPRQSLIELSKVESSFQQIQKGQNFTLPSPSQKSAIQRGCSGQPKRKLLEDCIQRVKREKLINENDQEQGQPSASHSSSASVNESMDAILIDKGVSAKTDDSLLGSDVDSGALIIDTSESENTRRSMAKRTRRRDSATASSTASSSSSSSALLKALTRPVDGKSAGTKSTQEIGATSQDDEPVNSEEPPREDDTTGSRANVVQKDETTADSKVQATDVDSPIRVWSPLFEKYTCDICVKDFNTSAQLMSHTHVVHTAEKLIFPCIFCSFSFINLECVCRHIMDIHKKSKDQAIRLMEVVKSRSHMSADFLGCSDYSSTLEQTTTLQHDDISDKDSIDAGELGDNDEDDLNEIDNEVDNEAEDVVPDSGDADGDALEIEGIKRKANEDGAGANEGDDDENEGGEERVEHEELNDCQESPKNEDNMSHLGDQDCGDDNRDEEEEDAENHFSHKELVIHQESSSDGDDMEEEADEDVEDNDDDDDEEEDEDDDGDDGEDDDDGDDDEAEKPVNHRELNNRHESSRDQDDMEEETDEDGEDDDDEEEEGEDEDEDEDDDDDDEAEKHVDHNELANCNESSRDHYESKHSNSSLLNTSKLSSDGTPPSNASGSGGIMKLKIQLKAQPDEKSKVYRIV